MQVHGGVSPARRRWGAALAALATVATTSAAAQSGQDEAASHTRFDTVGPSSPSGRVDVLWPFPVVRVAGTVTRGGARIRVLSARTPNGALASVVCQGSNCPRTAGTDVRLGGSRPGGLLRFRVVERSYPAGVVLRVSVTAPGKWGKYTRVEIREGRLPAREDTCLRPGEKRRTAPCSAIPTG